MLVVALKMVEIYSNVCCQHLGVKKELKNCILLVRGLILNGEYEPCLHCLRMRRIKHSEGVNRVTIFRWFYMSCKTHIKDCWFTIIARFLR